MKTLRERKVRCTEAAFSITTAACPSVKTQTVRSKVSKNKRYSIYNNTTNYHIRKLEAKKPDLDTADFFVCVYTNDIANARNQEIAYELKSAISKPAVHGKFSTYCNVFINCSFKFNNVP
jgi:hypothetical protein